MKRRILLMRHINKMIGTTAGGRVAFAISHILLMALSVFFAFCIKWSFDFMTTESFFAGLFALIISIAATFFAFTEGFVCQLALVVIAGIHIKADGPEDKSANVAAMVIALLTSVGLVIAGLIAVVVFL